MQQIYRRTTMPKWDFNKVACNVIEVALRHGCSLVDLLHIFRALFHKNTSRWLLLTFTSNGFCFTFPQCNPLSTWTPGYLFQRLHETSSPAHRPGSFGRIRPLSVFGGFDTTNIYLKPPGPFGRIRLLSVFVGFDITNIYLKPNNRPIFEKNTSTVDSCPFCAPVRQSGVHRDQSVIVPLNIVIGRRNFAQTPYFLWKTSW